MGNHKKTLTFDTFENRELFKNTVLLQPLSWPPKSVFNKNKKQREQHNKKTESNLCFKNGTWG